MSVSLLCLLCDRIPRKHGSAITVRTRRRHNVGLKLVQRLRRWPNVTPTSAEIGALTLSTPNWSTEYSPTTSKGGIDEGDLKWMTN